MNINEHLPSGNSLGKISGDVDYFLTQILSGYGGFQSYLHDIGKAQSPDCVFCNGVADDAERSHFSSDRWGGFRQQFYADTGKFFPDNIVKEVLRSAGSWCRVAHYVQALRIAKKIEFGRCRDRMVRGFLN